MVGAIDHLTKGLSATSSSGTVALANGAILAQDVNGQTVTNYSSANVTFAVDSSTPGVTLNNGNPVTGSFVGGKLQAITLKLVPSAPILVNTTFLIDITDVNSGLTTTLSVTMTPTQSTRT